MSGEEKIRTPFSWRKDEYGSLKERSTWKQISIEFFSHRLLANMLYLFLFGLIFSALFVSSVKFQKNGNFTFNLSFLSLSVGGIILAFEEQFDREFIVGLSSYNFTHTAFSFLYSGGLILLIHILGMFGSSFGLLPAQIIPSSINLTATEESLVAIATTSLGTGFFLVIVWVFILLASLTFSSSIVNTLFIIFSTKFVGFERHDLQTPDGPIVYYKNQLVEKIRNEENSETTLSE